MDSGIKQVLVKVQLHRQVSVALKVFSQPQTITNMTDKIIDPNWIKKAPTWKMFLAKLFGKKIAGIDGEYYAISYQFLGKRYYAGGGFFNKPKPQEIFISSGYEYWDETAEVTPEAIETLKKWKPKTQDRNQESKTNKP